MQMHVSQEVPQLVVFNMVLVLRSNIEVCSSLFSPKAYATFNLYTIQMGGGGMTHRTPPGLAAPGCVGVMCQTVKTTPWMHSSERSGPVGPVGVFAWLLRESIEQTDQHASSLFHACR